MADPTPKHSHPFTLDEAVLLPFTTLTQEIARLQNSIRHLRSSQEALREHIRESEERDLEVEGAVEENEGAIAAQEERITILQTAIERKGGALSSGHYDPAVLTMNGRPVPRVSPTTTAPHTNGAEPPGDRAARQNGNGDGHVEPGLGDGGGEEEDGGVFL